MWPVKSCQMSIKVAQKDFTRIMKDFGTFTKFYWKFGHNNSCHGLWKVVHSAINCPIWSHWTETTMCVIESDFVRTRKNENLCEFESHKRDREFEREREESYMCTGERYCECKNVHLTTVYYSKADKGMNLRNQTKLSSTKLLRL